MISGQSLTGFFISPDVTIRDAVEVIDRGQLGIALVVDEQQRLIGTITDGDVRRALLDEEGILLPVRTLLDKKKDSPYPAPLTASPDTSHENLLTLMREKVIRQIPLVDEDKKVVGMATLDTFLPNESIPVEAMIMAGGFGKRLSPLTEQLPKPLLPVGGRPIMEKLIEQLQQTGVRQINVSTHFMADKVKEQFGSGETLGVEINYIEEDRPLGTAGALGLIAPPKETLLVVNGDIVTQLNFRSMYEFHRDNNADMSVGVRQYSFEVPYGVLKCEGAFVREVREKPTHNFLVNAGIYLLEPHVIGFIPPGEHLDMTNLIETLIKERKTVISFPIVEYWLDIGQHDDYEQAQRDSSSGKI